MVLYYEIFTCKERKNKSHFFFNQKNCGNIQFFLVLAPFTSEIKDLYTINVHVRPEFQTSNTLYLQPLKVISAKNKKDTPKKLYNLSLSKNVSTFYRFVVPKNKLTFDYTARNGLAENIAQKV